MTPIEIKAALLATGYQHVTVTDCGSYATITAEPAQAVDGVLQLGRILRDLGLNVVDHHQFLETEFVRATAGGAA